MKKRTLLAVVSLVIFTIISGAFFAPVSAQAAGVAGTASAGGEVLSSRSTKTSSKKKCRVSGCNEKAESGSNYCSYHTCKESGCNKPTVNGVKNSYCSTHKCKTSGCTNRYWYTDGKYKGYCRKCVDKQWSKDIKSGKVTAPSSSGSSKKVEMPDCDDYESYEDFMDEWDGRMPDGSDAEDYWENW